MEQKKPFLTPDTLIAAIIVAFVLTFGLVVAKKIAREDPKARTEAGILPARERG